MAPPPKGIVLVLVGSAFMACFPELGEYTAAVGGGPSTTAAGGGGTGGAGQVCAGLGETYVKASNTGAGDFFGISVALSAEGSTLAVGARYEASASTGVNQAEGDDTAGEAGAVYVFTRNGSTWAQQAYIKASNTDASDQFGVSVALSADGSTLAVGATFEDSGIADPSDDSANAAGAVYVFTRDGGGWSPQAYVKPMNPGQGDLFGGSVSLSADGSTLAVGAHLEDGNAKGINTPPDESALDAGAVYVFARGSTSWTQQAYVKASNTSPGDQFGASVALSADGLTLAVGASLEDSSATGVADTNGQNDDLFTDAGAAYVFTNDGSNWAQQAYVKASNTDRQDEFGGAVALSADGSTLAVAARLEDSDATGVDGVGSATAAPNSGAVYLFARNSVAWTPQAYVKASNTGAGDEFGTSVALAADGSALAIGSPNSAGRGAVHGFRLAGTWAQQNHVTASNADAGDLFGWSVSLSADCSLLAVGAFTEDSASVGIDTDATSNTATDAGAAYVFQ